MKGAVAAAVGLSAFLLFTLELLIARHLLPQFGGAGAVWLACLFFFQVVLLGGYAWGSALSAASVRAQRLHLGVLLLGLGALAVQCLVWGRPLLVPGSQAQGESTLGVLKGLAVAVGLPFFALSATAPLVQAWETRRGDLAPWRLYALSNAGALGALAAYPFWLEPNVGIQAQAWAWAAAFALDAGLLAWLTVARASAGRALALAATSKGGALAWVGLGFLGSFTLAAVTNFQVNDVTPAPLLWAAPLAVYLVSFIVTFENERWYRRDVASALIALGLLGITACLARDELGLAARIGAFALFELGVCLVCHGELYRLRPEPARLGAYYLWLSFGGALATAAVSGLFPLVTRDYVEFPLLVAVVPLGFLFVPAKTGALKALRSAALLALAAGLLFVWVQRRDGQAFSDRNFFGVVRVERDGDAWALIHSGTVHGRQPLDPAFAQEPTAYYARETGLGQTVTALRARRQGPLEAAVLGLGIGTTAALFEAGDEVVFYELNPAVAGLAGGERGFFSYLQKSKARSRVVLGDARVMLEQSSPGHFDLLVVDVFSGDSVPLHLLTREALQLYLAQLKPDGVLALHLSNRFLQLDRVAFGLAQGQRLAVVGYQSPASALAADATWVLMARDEAALPPLNLTPPRRSWREVRAPVEWTDDLASILPVIR